MAEFDSENEKKIHRLLKQHSGLHLSKIAELLTMNISEVEHCLQHMENQGQITATEHLGYKQYSVKSYSLRGHRQKTSELRQHIYTLIVQSPGIHTSKIAELLRISTQLTDYHLIYLEKKKVIFTTKDPREYYRKYYATESTITSQDKKLLDVLSKRIPFEILLLLLKHQILQHKDIAKKLNISPSKLSYHLTKLVDDDIVDTQPYGDEKGYIVKNKEEIVRILRLYQKKITLSLAVDEFNELWDDFQDK